MRSNFGCCRGFFGVGIGRIPGNLCAMVGNRNNCNCCNCCNNCNCCSDCDDYNDNDCGCEYNGRNRSSGC